MDATETTVMVQSNIFESAFLGDQDMDGTVEIKVVSGGPVAAYASRIDNRTQDPILIPAIEVVGAAVD